MNTKVSPETAYFLKALFDSPKDRIGVNDAYYGTDPEKEDDVRYTNEQLQSLLLPVLYETFSDNNNVLSTLARQFSDSSTDYESGGTCTLTLGPEKMAEVISFFAGQGVEIPSDLLPIRNHFSY